MSATETLNRTLDRAGLQLADERGRKRPDYYRRRTLRSQAVHQLLREATGMSVGDRIIPAPALRRSQFRVFPAVVAALAVLAAIVIVIPVMWPALAVVAVVNLRAAVGP